MAPSPHFVALEVADEDGTIKGMAGFDNWTKTSVEIFGAMDSPMVSQFIGGALHYAFTVCGMRALRATIAASNRRSLRFVKHLGFKESHRMRDGWAEGDDLVFVELYAADCERWLRPFKVRKVA